MRSSARIQVRHGRAVVPAIHKHRSVHESHHGSPPEREEVNGRDNRPAMTRSSWEGTKESSLFAAKRVFLYVSASEKHIGHRMTSGTLYQSGWNLDDVSWECFEPGKVECGLLAAVKSAALVEYNAPDYVAYLTRVFRDASAQTRADIEQWGREEIQHGLALGRWAELADPAFDFRGAFARFQAGYKPPHFATDDPDSVRGSRRGEMIARCVVESGTSSFYTAIRDAADEPVLKEIAGRIAADEFRHYKLFLETLHRQDEPELPWWRRLLVAVTRVSESSDDELAYAYYCANVPPAQEAATPYRRRRFGRAYNAQAMKLYRRHHIAKLVQMVAKAIGAEPRGTLARAASAMLWNVLRLRASLARGTA